MILYIEQVIQKKIDQYKLAISTDPSRIEAYIGSNDAMGLVQYVIDDGVLDTKEHNTLQEIRFGFDIAGDGGEVTTVKALAEELQTTNPEGYKQVCYEIGESYLFYYSQKAENANYERASDWFQYVRADYSLASVTCETYECLKNIQKYSKTGQTAKEYEEYKTLWKKIETLQKNSAPYDDDLKLRVWNSIVDMIRDNAVQFYEVATENDIVKMLNDISDSSAKVTNKILKESVDNLQSNITTTIVKVQSIKTGNKG